MQLARIRSKPVVLLVALLATIVAVAGVSRTNTALTNASSGGSGPRPKVQSKSPWICSGAANPSLCYACCRSLAQDIFYKCTSYGLPPDFCEDYAQNLQGSCVAVSCGNGTVP